MDPKIQAYVGDISDEVDAYIWVRYVTRLVLNNKHQQDMCSDEIGRYAHIYIFHYMLKC